MSNPLLRVILCGKTTSVGKAVTAGLKPEIEEIPLILSNQYQDLPQPKPSEEIIGTQNFNVKPDAVMLGGGYDASDAQILDGENKIPIFLADRTKPAPPLATGEYGTAILKRAKYALLDWEKDTKRGERENPIWY
ncbi:hypothetical protein L486_03009 [Kwoniella mangroviensis CBS 10435]|uniref:Uncharacterized protein n=1 Tax=Kwoniella mangroviensis CBS 10435 TaxID=1331196 RepID=A0A1B9IXR3_9TREE|nr:hypothetical protein L486_03009 [Kwoniella mangroviensis CBS 10435]